MAVSGTFFLAAPRKMQNEANLEIAVPRRLKDLRHADARKMQNEPNASRRRDRRQSSRRCVRNPG
jgi:hypothetical protein